MAKFLAGVLSVIAVGVLLIAYGLLSPRASAYQELSPLARPMFASEQGPLPMDPVAARNGIVAPFGTYNPYFQPPAYAYPSYVSATQAVARPMPAVITEPAPRRVTRAVEGPRRNWGKTALVIGGSTAAGAGVGGILGGKKGALIGAAIGGGASTIFESTRGK